MRPESESWLSFIWDWTASCCCFEIALARSDSLLISVRSTDLISGALAVSCSGRSG